jgi:hypothetical protein
MLHVDLNKRQQRSDRSAAIIFDKLNDSLPSAVTTPCMAKFVFRIPRVCSQPKENATEGGDFVGGGEIYKNRPGAGLMSRSCMFIIAQFFGISTSLSSSSPRNRIKRPIPLHGAS